MTVFTWITCAAASPVYLANMVEGWHATLIMWSFFVIPVIWSFYCRRLLSTLEMVSGICHVIFFTISAIEVYYQATKDKNVVIILVSMMAWILFICLFNIFTSAFTATEKGPPFSNIFTHVSIPMFQRTLNPCYNTDVNMRGNRCTQSWKFR